MERNLNPSNHQQQRLFSNRGSPRRMATIASGSGGSTANAFQLSRRDTTQMEDGRSTAGDIVARRSAGIGTTVSAASRRSMELAQSVRQRRSILGQMPSSAASTAGTHSLSLVSLAPKIDNRSALVIEIGTRLTRIGFAGEYVPREIFRSEWIDPLDGPCPHRPVALFDRSSGEQAQYEVLCKFLKNIVFRKLLTTAAARRVVLVESLLTPSWQRQALARAIFECPSISPHSVLFAPSHLLCTFPFNARTCLVIDCCSDEALLFPVAEGVLMLNQWETSSTPCASALERSVRQLMRHHGRIRRDADDPGRPLEDADLSRADAIRLWEDLAVRFCFVTTAARGKRVQAHLTNAEAHPFECTVPAVEIQFGTGLLVVPGLVREGAAEVMFTHCAMEQDLRSVPQLVLDCVSKTTVDLRREFLKNLLLVGGVTLLPGFLARLKTELLSLIADNYHPKIVPRLQDIRFHQFPTEVRGQLFGAWLGGAMFGALDESLEHRSLTRQQWLDRRRVPDWTSAIDAPPDKGSGKSQDSAVPASGKRGERAM